ncbi:MAG: hypothetical protein KUG71_04390 [Porticoccaceae bacterium]|nr:hypothetical protein [Porticoccaceae bacterium]
MINNLASRALSACSILLFLNLSSYANAQVDVLVDEIDQGYKLEINFFTPLRYVSHTPEKSGSTLEIQLQPELVADAEHLNELGRQRSLIWDKSTNIPLRDINFDIGLAQRPTLILRFTRHVKFNVRNSSDLRSIIINIETPRPAQKETVSNTLPAVSSQSLIATLKQTDPKMAGLLQRANQAMIDKNYSSAVQLFMKIRDKGNLSVRAHAQELLGVAREYNGQFAHAKAEYERYLQDYPDSPGLDRVNQRLTALITAATKPKERLKSGRRSRTQDPESWNTQFFGSISQIYYRDEMNREEGGSQLTRSELTNDLDFVGRARKGRYDLKTQFVGGFEEDFRPGGEGGEFIPSIMSFDGRDSESGLYARVGRQSRTTGGILGRFDGIHAAYEVTPEITLNTVYGHPVDTRHKTQIRTNNEFYGVSADIGPHWGGWDFNAFYITQDNFGINDREAVGGEARYFDTRKSIFTLVDYDIDYNDLNIFLLIGSLTVKEGTTLNLVLDYRNSPILTTTNAIQGQGVEELEELLGVFSDDELFQLAEDRTSDSESVTTGITQRINETWQVIGEVTVTEFGDTRASGGVEAIPGTGKEYYYSTQLLANSLFYENDSAILGARYADTLNANTYTLDANWRVSYWDRRLRLNPRIRLDYREDKRNTNDRWFVRPFIKTDYRLRKWMKLEFEFGYEWLDQSFSDESQKTTRYFLSIGYRAQF